MTYVKSYYAGAYRITIDGVPLRVARKPSVNTLKLVREHTRYIKSPEGGWMPARRGS